MIFGLIPYYILNLIVSPIDKWATIKFSSQVPLFTEYGIITENQNGHSAEKKRSWEIQLPDICLNHNSRIYVSGHINKEESQNTRQSAVKQFLLEIVL